VNWIGKDTFGGPAPAQKRKDRPEPPAWRLEWVVSARRPHHLEVSPDGRMVTFTLDESDLGSNLWSLDPGTGAVTQLTTDRPPAPFWEDTPGVVSPDGAMLAYESDGWIRVVPVGGGVARSLVKGSGPVWLADGRLLVGVDHPRSQTATDLPSVTEVTRLTIIDPADPWPAPLSPPTADVIASEAARRAASVAAVRFPPEDRNRSDVVVIDVESGETIEVAGAPGIHSHGPAWSPDGATIAYVSEEPGWYEIHLAASTGGRARQLTDDEADFGSLMWSPDGSQILATRTRRGRTDLVTVDPVTGQSEVVATGGVWSDPAYLADGWIVAIYEDHRTPARIEVFDPARRVLFDPAPAAVRSAPHVSPVEVTFRSGGLDIHGFLFVPPGASRNQRKPVVVYPHGGPTSHYGDEWDGHAQYFVDKGYGWLAINFRGSTSYGRTFERSAHGLWGVADTADCLAAADHLATLEWVDPDRIAIFGASYGSYLALSSLVSDPEHRFACGIAKYGDCNILTSWAQGDRGGSEDLERQMGHPGVNRVAYLAGSPIHGIDQIARPLLVAHGEQDRRVHPQQSEELVKELGRLGKTFEYVTYPTEGHGLLRREPHLDFYRRLERFLDWYLL
jgi:dipeptidyl aminopeptidase/acylaminoacyl peptidase